MVPREEKLKTGLLRDSQQVDVALKGETKIPLITSELNTMKYNRKVIGYPNQ